VISLAEFSDIVLNTTAERIETIANMDINSDVIDENSNDGSLPTSKAVYEAIKNIEVSGGGGTVDQTYDPESENAQSGKAVNEALTEFSNSEVKIKRVEFSNGAIITVQDNTEYTATEPITNLVIIYPETDFICSFSFTLAESGNITIDLPESKYIGTTPTFANGETWELNIKNGIVVGGLVE
jgi:hypothetical protein